MSVSKHTHEELANRFIHHPPHGDQAGRYAMVRDICLDAAKKIVELTPACAEQTRAINLLDDAMMRANAAIARHTPT